MPRRPKLLRADEDSQLLAQPERETLLPFRERVQFCLARMEKWQSQADYYTAKRNLTEVLTQLARCRLEGMQGRQGRDDEFRATLVAFIKEYADMVPESHRGNGFRAIYHQAYRGKLRDLQGDLERLTAFYLRGAQHDGVDVNEHLRLQQEKGIRCPNPAPILALMAQKAKARYNKGQSDQPPREKW